MRTRSLSGLLGGAVVKNPPANTGDARDVGLIPRSGRSPGEENGTPVHYFCLENSMDRGAWRAIVNSIATPPPATPTPTRSLSIGSVQPCTRAQGLASRAWVKLIPCTCRLACSCFCTRGVGVWPDSGLWGSLQTRSCLLVGPVASRNHSSCSTVISSHAAFRTHSKCHYLLRDSSGLIA